MMHDDTPSQPDFIYSPLLYSTLPSIVSQIPANGVRARQASEVVNSEYKLLGELNITQQEFNITIPPKFGISVD